MNDGYPDNRYVPQTQKTTHKALFLLHIFTASGAALAFLALVAATNGAWAAMFFWLGVALFVDAIDGPIARRTNIAEKLPRWSGEILDLVVDYVTYVFVPAYAIAASGLMPDVIALIAGMAITVTSAIYFADRKMKMADNYFRGFPAIWNIAAFYLILLSPPAWVSVLFVAALTVLTFLPVPFIHPVRVVRFRRLNLCLLVLWSVLAVTAIVHGMAPGALVTSLLSMLGVYILGGGFLRGGLSARAEKRQQQQAAT